MFNYRPQLNQFCRRSPVTYFLIKSFGTVFAITAMYGAIYPSIGCEEATKFNVIPVDCEKAGEIFHMFFASYRLGAVVVPFSIDWVRIDYIINLILRLCKFAAFTMC